jgi:hypothetical protein
VDTIRQLKCAQYAALSRRWQQQLLLECAGFDLRRADNMIIENKRPAYSTGEETPTQAVAPAHLPEVHLNFNDIQANVCFTRVG